MRLVDCDPKWIEISETGAIVGLTLHCPIHERGKSHGVHHCAVYFKNPIPGRNGEVENPYTRAPQWDRTGETFDTLTTTPSVLNSIPGCGWHGYITNGEVSVC